MKSHTTRLSHRTPPVFDIERFGASLPTIVGTVADRRTLDGLNLRVLDMPVRFPGSEDYRLPREFLALAPLLKQIVQHERAINSRYEEYYAYLTVDVGTVAAGTSQRRGGLHVDGFQGARITQKTFVNSSYLVANVLPTIFSQQRYRVGRLDIAKHNFFHAFDRQAKPENEWQAHPYQIVRADAHCVHRAAVASRAIRRVFLRVSFDTKVFDRLGNTHNDLFDYDWEMVKRGVQATLLE